MPRHAALAARPPSRKRTSFMVFLVLLVLAGIVYRFLLPSTVSLAPSQWQAIICDVGQGSAALIRTGEHRAILVDTGSQGEDLTGCLRWAQIDGLDAVIISHAHEDHMGNIAETYPLLQKVEKAKILCSPLMQQNCNFTAADSPPVAVEQVNTQQKLTYGKGQLSFLWPANEIPPSVDTANANNQSLIIYAQSASSSGGSALTLLLPGDAEKSALATALSPYSPTDPLQVDLLVLPHHGSRTSGTSYLSQLATGYAAVSAGANNSYGHPHPEVVQQMNNNGVKMVNTAEHGSLAFWKEHTRLKVAVQHT